ncbi:thioredoxin-dependent thiol peroxidase [Kocuria nitroreducens]|uniref:thioredoxin-dependent thiol peroxidase n=1 Tax=Kocuria nitroreducens TaxID=3058914 RepID=UPI0036DE6FD3
MAPQIRTGRQAPDFTLTDHEERQVQLSELRGRRVVVYFYPKAFTPGCTTEACDFRDNLASLEALGATVLGISGDDPATLRRFAEEHQLSYRLLSDPDSATARAWGAWGEKTVDGQTVVGPLRSTFVIERDGTVSSAEHNVRAEGHVADLRGRLAG